jgi:hypothetical protein
MSKKVNPTLDALLSKAASGGDVSNFSDTELRTFLDSRYSQTEEDRERELARIFAKVTAGRETLKRQAWNNDEVQARRRSVEATVSAVNWALHPLKRDDKAKAVRDWCRRRAGEITTTLARENQINSASDRVGDLRLSQYLARKIQASLPGWVRRDVSTVERYIKHELRRHVEEGKRQRPK